jgi:protein-S-isoprenylcysteine O-methyltransferase Ste14
MLTLLLQLLLAHLVGDFLLQSANWVAHKNKYKLKSKYLYIHIAIHLILLLIVTKFDRKYIVAILLITITHFIIDALKLSFQKKKTAKRWFFADQVAHIAVIIGVVYYFYPFVISVDTLYSPEVLAVLVSLVTVTYVSAIVLKFVMKKWSVKKGKETHSINDAGKYIGILERLFIFFFVVIDFWEGIGFLLAAKSIFRFGDLKESKDIRLTEYILIGTLLSFAIGIGCAMCYKFLLTVL